MVNVYEGTAGRLVAWAFLERVCVSWSTLRFCLCTLLPPLLQSLHLTLLPDQPPLPTCSVPVAAAAVMGHVPRCHVLLPESVDYG